MISSLLHTVKLNMSGIKRTAVWRVQALRILKEICEDEIAAAFLDPVNPKEFDIPDYPLVVQQPMDFGTVIRKLESQRKGTSYRNMSQFIEDVQLIFTNAKMYNNPDHEVYKEACECQELFHSKISPVVGKSGDQPTRKKWKFFNKPGGFKFGLEFAEKLNRNDKE